MTTVTKTDLQDINSGGLFCLIGCPYLNGSRKTCTLADGFPGSNGTYRASYCMTDDHDACPLYLCQALRSSRATGYNRESIGTSGK